MAEYRFQAYDRNGKRVAGALQAVSEADALAQVSLKNLTPTHLSSVGTQQTSFWQIEWTLLRSNNRIRPADLEVFLSEFGLLVDTGISVDQALKICMGHAKVAPVRKLLEDLQQSLADGLTITEALGRFEHLLPNNVYAALLLGDKSNSLGKSALLAADALRKAKKLRQDLISLLIYPAILIMMSLVIMFAVIFFIAPALTPMFEGTSIEPSWLLRFASTTTEFVDRQLPAIAAGLLVFLIAAALGSSQISKASRAMLLKLPFVQKFRDRLLTLQFCHTLNLMSQSGATLASCLSECASVTNDLRWKQGIQSCVEAMNNGKSFSLAIQEIDGLEADTRDLLVVGDETGRFAAMLKTVMKRLESQIQNQTKQTMALVTPVLTLVIGLFVGWIVVSTLTSILDLNEIAL